MPAEDYLHILAYMDFEQYEAEQRERQLKAQGQQV